MSDYEEFNYRINHGSSSSYPPISMKYDGSECEITVGWNEDNTIVVNWKDMDKLCAAWQKWRQMEGGGEE